MRERFFKILLHMLERHTPGRFKSIQLQILLNTTAEAFQRPGKMIWYLPAEKALEAYADYTKACAEDMRTGRKQVYRCARRLGRRIRKITGFNKREDLERLVFYLYDNIGIKMTGRLPGRIVIPVCYFSNVYTPGQCRIMSLMDMGVISGICGGGRLIFTERLTQGCGRCLAHLTRKGRLADG